MKNVILGLENIADLITKNSELSKIQAALQSAKTFVQESKKLADPAGKTLLAQLETELGTWQLKLSAIMSEPVGRQGMAKHAHFWAEKLRAIHV